MSDWQWGLYKKGEGEAAWWAVREGGFVVFCVSLLGLMRESHCTVFGGFELEKVRDQLADKLTSIMCACSCKVASESPLSGSWRVLVKGSFEDLYFWLCLDFTNLTVTCVIESRGFSVERLSMVQ